VQWALGETGSCSGRLNGTLVTDAPATIQEQLQDDIGGCGPTSDAHGPGLLTFTSGVQLHYRVRHGLGLGQPLVAKGDESGVAIGLVEAFTENGPSALQQRVTSSFTSGRLLYVLQTLDKLRG
jgi:hypothetical protein